jgi:hypothetical protein
MAFGGLWALATALGAGLGHGVIAALVGVGIEMESGGLPPVLVGGFDGAVTGVFQWLVLRRRVGRAGWWIVASSIGWSAGVVAVAATPDLGELFSGALATVASLFLPAMVGGALYGAITGLALAWLFGSSVPEAGTDDAMRCV